MDKIIENFKDILINKYAQFKGRADKAEFWQYILIYIIISVVLYLLINIFGSIGILRITFIIIQILFSLVMLLPSIAVGVRRMHDIGKGGGWIFINLLPIVGQIWFLLLAIKDSEPGTNRFNK